MAKANRAQYMKEVERVVAEGVIKYGPGQPEEPEKITTGELQQEIRRADAIRRGQQEKKTQQFTRIQDVPTGERIKKLFQQINSQAPVDKQLTTILPEPYQGALTQIIPEPIKFKADLEKLSEAKTEVLKEPKQPKEAKPKAEKPVNFEKLQDKIRDRQLAQLTQIQRVGQSISKIGQNIDRRTANWPVFPGGIALPLTLLLLLVIMLLPVNGHTRIVWLWKTLTGTALVQPTTVSQGQSQTQTTSGTGKGSGPDSKTPSVENFSQSYYRPLYFEMDEY